MLITAFCWCLLTAWLATDAKKILCPSTWCLPSSKWKVYWPSFPFLIPPLKIFIVGSRDHKMRSIRPVPKLGLLLIARYTNTIVCTLCIISELGFTFAICYRTSVCRLSSVCLSSVMFVIYSGGSNFPQYFYGIRYVGYPLTSTENFTEILPGEPLRRGS